LGSGWNDGKVLYAYVGESFPKALQVAWFQETLTGQARNDFRLVIDRLNKSRRNKKSKLRARGLPTTFPAVGAADIIVVYRRLYWPKENDGCRVQELATLEVDSFDGRTLLERWSIMFLHARHLQSLTGHGFQSKEALFAYLYRAIAFKKELDGVNLKSGGMDPNALDVAVREGIMTDEQRIEDMRAIERRLKRKYPLYEPFCKHP
jgi:hypothetical protein